MGHHGGAGRVRGAKVAAGTSGRSGPWRHCAVLGVGCVLGCAMLAAYGSSGESTAAAAGGSSTTTGSPPPSSDAPPMRYTRAAALNPWGLACCAVASTQASAPPGRERPYRRVGARSDAGSRDTERSGASHVVWSGDVDRRTRHAGPVQLVEKVWKSRRRNVVGRFPELVQCPPPRVPGVVARVTVAIFAAG